MAKEVRNRPVANNANEIVAIVVQLLLLAGIYALYPVRLAWYSWNRGAAESFWRCMRISAAFDPAPYVYPTLLPVIVALSLFPNSRDALMPNLVLGLSAVLPGIISLKPSEIVNPFHWMISLLPSIMEEVFTQHKDPHREMLAALYPFHAHLVTLLCWFITSSLLPAEYALLSISLLNNLFLSKSPPAKILAIVLWIGGSGVLLTCSPFIKWGVALARIPRWRLKRTGRIAAARQHFIKLLNNALQTVHMKSKATDREVVESDADDDDENDMPINSHLQALKLEVINTLKHNFFPPEVEDDETRSAVEKPLRPSFFRQNSSDTKKRQRRRHTLPSGIAPLPQGAEDDNNPMQPLVEKRRRKRRRLSTSTSFYLSLTYEQALLRKWVYASVIYTCMIVLILLPIRYLVSIKALSGAEPFGWAIGYLLGDLRDVRLFVVTSPLLSSWIPLPELREPFLGDMSTIGRAQDFTQHVVGAANMRLWISAWCLATIVIGLAAVLTLDFVEVDTRRKVFHGTMVAMLLPTIFIDPSFIALALALVLAIFLLLDLLRAGQVPPLSKPIAQFLTPYVDGRDLRGPVVISHVFLLIGCAVPLWLSLAAAELSLDSADVWKAWTIKERDVSMISGVVCVGMGDAMASLVGRRYGRRKWPWSGGKSFEGSAAFAGAVAVGLVASKWWLDYGQWNGTEGTSVWTWTTTVVKSLVAGSIASGMEAALTGGNDNVVVPVVLWIVVRVLAI
jgi:dolichol kinase